MIKFIVNKSNVNNIPSNVTHLIFNDYFNQPLSVGVIPNSVTHLVFGCEFNQIVDIPNSVTHLLFGYNFNRPLYIPNSLIYLRFGYEFNQIVDIPNSVKDLTIGNEFDIVNNIIPNNVIHLTYNILYEWHKEKDYETYKKRLETQNKFIVEKVNHLIINLDFQLMIDSEYIITNEMISKIYKNLVISIIDFFDDSIDDSIDNIIKYNNEIIQDNENFYIKYKNMILEPYKDFFFVMEIERCHHNENDYLLKNGYFLENDFLGNCVYSIHNDYIKYDYYEKLCKKKLLIPIHSELITKVFNPIRLQKIANTYNIELVDLMDYY